MNPQTATRQPGTGTPATPAREQLLQAVPVSERTLPLAGISTPILEGGTGQPVILLHGPGGNAFHWMSLIPGLVRTHRVIAPDLPGHGASQVNDGPLDQHRVVRWLDELIDVTAGEAPIVVGAALGGAIALLYASQKNRIGRLILLGSMGLAPFEPTPEFGAALHQFLGRPTPETQEALWKECVYDLAELRTALGANWSAFDGYNLDRAQSPEVMASLMQLMELFGLPAIPPRDLEKIRVPTRLVWGRHDRAIPLGVARTASERYGWPLQVIEDAGADLALENPAAVAAAIDGTF